MKFLTKEQQESHENTKICYNSEEKFENKYLKDKKYCELRDYYYYTGEYRGAVQRYVVEYIVYLKEFQ